MPADGERPTDGERIQKVLAAAGVASRRVVEDMIAAGRIAVNGEVVREPGRRVDAATDRITVDGVAVQSDPTRRYVVLNKPTGVVSTLRDENGRPDLTRYTERYQERLFNVGRLDTDTSGLLLLTNDGDLGHVLTHPSFGVEKTYVALVAGTVHQRVLARLREGIELDDGAIRADRVRIVPGGARTGATLVELTLHSGRNRIVRRMMAEVGHPVQELVRRSFGPLALGALPSGATRDLTKEELGALLTLARR